MSCISISWKKLKDKYSIKVYPVEFKNIFVVFKYKNIFVVFKYKQTRQYETKDQGVTLFWKLLS